MDIKEAIGKLEGVDEATKATLTSSLTDIVDAANKERDGAVHARNRASDSEKALKSEMAEMKSQMETLQNEDMSEADKLAKENEKTVKERDALLAERDTLTTQLSTNKRDNAVGRIHDGIKWNREHIPADDTLAGISRALNDVDLEDKAAVKAATDEYLTARPHYVMADSNGGVGSQNDGGQNPGGDGRSATDLDGVNVLDKDELNNALAADKAAGDQ